ncbi:MAG: hypothetical protein Q4C87_12705 [Actinomycetaceae bacterium]|nr:hypothetical protein [Actinomycetaceae bacterium]
MRPFSDAVIAHIERLGGSWKEVSENATLTERTCAINFPKRLLDVDTVKDHMSPEALGLPSIEAIKEMDQPLPDVPVTEALPCGVRWAGDEWQPWGVQFEGQKNPLDFAEIDEDILEDMLEALNRTTGTRIIQVTWSDGWPNHHLFLDDDPHPEDPAVYSTDHEVYMSEIERPAASLSEWLSEMLTDDEVYALIAQG